jgi:GNAT superfamily N-acetyltransferase
VDMKITLRRMTPDDIPLGMRLKALAGWNQTAADWEMLLEAGRGLVAVIDGVAVGTATVVGYGQAFSWVGMVLVDPTFRRRGIGTALLDAAILAGRRYGAVRLDATPQGEPLYRRLGFAVEYGLMRMRRSGAQPSAAPATDDFRGRVEMLATEWIPEIAAYDAPLFGARRDVILGALQRRATGYALCIRRGDEFDGYCLGRVGSGCDQIGPLMAGDAEIAQRLLVAALRNSGGRDVIVDVPTSSPGWLEVLERQGFVAERPFTRMCLGNVGGFGQPEKEFAIAGPELG